MKVVVDGLSVLFPYDYIYPEQLQYMHDLKCMLDASGHGLIEMPSGTGKTATILSLLLAYQREHPDRHKQIIYCTRTVPEIDKALGELKRIDEYRRQELGGDAGVVGVGLASRKNLCVNEQVLRASSYYGTVDSRCQSLTASWMRERPDNTGSCEYYETIESILSTSTTVKLPVGIYTLDELKEYGKRNRQCPYFLARHAMHHSHVIIYSYYYLLDPKVSELVSRHLPKDAVVVFDEAHNIDNVCIESLSVELTKPVVESASRSLSLLQDHINIVKQQDQDRLRVEYEQLVAGLAGKREERMADRIMANPVLPDDLLFNHVDDDQHLVPGNIRKAEHFVAFMRRFVEFLRARFRRCLHVVSETPAAFLQSLHEQTMIERRPMRFCTERLQVLMRTLRIGTGHEINGGMDVAAVSRVAAFATVVSTYQTGFTVLFEPFDETAALGATSAVLNLACLDATIAMRPVLSRFRSVLITSGTLSPLDMYPRLLDFSPVVQSSLSMTMVRDTISPMIVTRGADQVAVSSRFEIRNDPAVVRNYGQLLVDFCRVVPDGLVAFFPSYTYLESIVSMWVEMGIIQEIGKLRMLFVETPDNRETAMALSNYRLACDNGLGAVLLSVARGKVSEGIDFTGHYGRAVLLFGIPYQYTESRILKSRLEYMRTAYSIRDTDFLTFDALRHAAQCLGRVLRGKTDYGLMVLADRRYSRADKRKKLPKWIGSAIKPAHQNLSADQAVVLAKRYYREMAKPVALIDQVGYAWLTEEDVARVTIGVHSGYIADDNKPI